jgi:hypothetical protein
MRVTVSPWGSVLGADVLFRDDDVPLVAFGSGIFHPLDLLVIEKYNRDFREYVETTDKIPMIVHRDGNPDNCVISNLDWIRPVVISKYFPALAGATVDASYTVEHGAGSRVDR